LILELFVDLFAAAEMIGGFSNQSGRGNRRLICNCIKYKYARLSDLVEKQWILPGEFV